MIGNREARDGFIQWARQWGSSPRKWALLLGPSGTGKTSLVYAYARQNGLEVFEVNRENWGRETNTDRLAEAASTPSSLTSTGSPRIILVDEVDTFTGIRANGLDKLFSALESTRVPVVFTANDQDLLYSSRKLYPLRSASCVQLRFGRIRKDVIQAALKRICAKEGVAADNESLASIAAKANGDLRAAINMLQAACVGVDQLRPADLEVIGERAEETYTYKAVLDIVSAPSMYTAKGVLESSGLDEQTVFKWLAENLPAYPKPSERVFDCVEALAQASVFDNLAERYMLYDLKKYFADLMCYAPQLLGERPFRKLVFPASLKLRGSSFEGRRILSEVASELGLETHVSRRRALGEVIPFLSVMANANPGFLEWLKSRFGDEGAEAVRSVRTRP